MSPVAAASWVTAVHATLIAITGLSTFIALLFCWKDTRRKREKNALYEDEDGVATEESQSQYQKTAKWLLIFLCFFSIVGLGTAIPYGINDISEVQGRYRSTASAILGASSATIIWVGVLFFSYLGGVRLSTTTVLHLHHND